MISPVERRELADSIAQYLGGGVHAQDMIGRLQPFDRSRDEAVQEIASDLAFELEVELDTDERRGEVLCLSRRTWKQLQRGLLFLRSDLPMEYPYRTGVEFFWRWHAGQLIGISGLGAAVLLFFVLPPWLAYAAAMGVAGICMWCSRERYDAKPIAPDDIPWDRIYPFRDFGQLLRQRRKDRTFVASPYPDAVCARYGYQDEPGVWDTYATFALLTLVWPVVLIVMCTPDRTLRGV